MFWVTCGVISCPKQPDVMMTERPAQTKTSRSSLFLVFLLICWLIHFVSHGWAPPPRPVALGEWYGLLLCVGYAVKRYEKRQLSEPHPKKCQPSSAHLLASVSPVAVPQFLQQDCPHVGVSGTASEVCLTQGVIDWLLLSKRESITGSQRFIRTPQDVSVNMAAICISHTLTYLIY